MEDLTFNEERAVAGDPVQFCETGGNWVVDVHFVGRDRVRGGWVVQFEDGRLLTTSALRMRPRSKWVLEFVTEADAEDARDLLQDLYPDLQAPRRVETN